REPPPPRAWPYGPRNVATRRCPAWTTLRSWPRGPQAPSEWWPRDRDRSSPLKGSRGRGPWLRHLSGDLSTRPSRHLSAPFRTPLTPHSDASPRWSRTVADDADDTVSAPSPLAASTTPSTDTVASVTASTATAAEGSRAPPSTPSNTPPAPIVSAEVIQSPNCMAEVLKPRSATGDRRRSNTDNDGIPSPIPAPPHADAATATHPGAPPQATTADDTRPTATQTNAARRQAGCGAWTGGRPARRRGPGASVGPARAALRRGARHHRRGRDAGDPARAPASRARRRPPLGGRERPVSEPVGSSRRSDTPTPP